MKQSRATELRDLIEEAIVTGVYAPGQRLDEVKLASRFGVSRTPVREALRQLEATELVDIQPHRGAFVKVIAIPEMLQMFEVMAELEGLCARLAARRCTEKQLRDLEGAHAACAATLQSADADEYYYANETFHKLLYAASGNSFLTRMATSLQTRLKPFRRLQLRVPGRMLNSSAEHGAIVTALRAADASSAEQLAVAHVTVQGDRFGDFLAALGSRGPEENQR
ncbi:MULTISPECIES: GntR family transcriptional regulator [unclassified Microbacterium]|uniref:GntR family transcriptional regulator n=1 Tax=unclassified Microbacterium TaxID=2609290 RepID=UPI00214AA4FA|nr:MULTISPECIES: GntR family transcriptional regulator [unclassified Microbacterium]MCR2810522.1 GntR family transcriptional regulator [Microbacterium sp. zg.B185]WIM19508.1 GntR family transcriptional regulator [Microbacterium sp. zg-B185]